MPALLGASLVCIGVLVAPQPASARTCPQEIAALIEGAVVVPGVSTATCETMLRAVRRIPASHRVVLAGLQFMQVDKLPGPKRPTLLTKLLSDSVLAIYAARKVIVTAAGAAGRARWTHGDVAVDELIPLLNQVRHTLGTGLISGPGDPALEAAWREFAKRAGALAGKKGWSPALGSGAVFEVLVEHGGRQLLGAASVEHVMVHELGHGVHQLLPAGRQIMEHWAPLSGWGVAEWNLAPNVRFTRQESVVVHLRHLFGGERGQTRYRPAAGAAFPTDYARFVPMEDFAEAYRWAIVAPEQLGDRAPAKLMAMNATGWVVGSEAPGPLLHGPAVMKGPRWRARLIQGTRRLLGLQPGSPPVRADDAAAIIRAHAAVLAPICRALGPTASKAGVPGDDRFDVQVGRCLLRPSPARVRATLARLDEEKWSASATEAFVALAEQAIDDLIAGRSAAWVLGPPARAPTPKPDLRVVDLLARATRSLGSGDPAAARRSLAQAGRLVLGPPVPADHYFPGRAGFALELRARYPGQSALAIMLRSARVSGHSSRTSARRDVAAAAVALGESDLARRAAKALGDNWAVIDLVRTVGQLGAAGLKLARELATRIDYPLIGVRVLTTVAWLERSPALLADARKAALASKGGDNRTRDLAGLARVWIRVGEKERARQVLTAALDASALGSSGPADTATNRLWAVPALLALGDRQQAQALLDDAIAKNSKTKLVPVYAPRFAAMAAASRTLGKAEEARRQLLRVKATLRKSKSAGRVQRIVTKTRARLGWEILP